MPVKMLDIGVLFIHGIGDHKDRETLIRCGEPFVNFWEGWFGGATKYSASRMKVQGEREAFCKREAFCQSVKATAFRNRRDQELINKLGEIKGAKDSTEAFCKEAIDKDTDKDEIIYAGVRVEDTLFKETGSKKPSSTLLRLTLVRKDGQIKESHLLMSESCWTDQTYYPTNAELVEWVFKALPAFNLLHLNFLTKAFVESPKPSTLITTIDCLISLIMILLWPLSFVLVVIIQAVLVLFIPFSFIPITWVQRLTGSIFNGLMSTIGQSYALKNSDVRRNAIVRHVMSDLEWMVTTCRKIVIISHSQGAEIARQVFDMQEWPNVKRWVTVGSGIVPLSMLEKDNLERRWMSDVYVVYGLCTVGVIIYILNGLSASTVFTNLLNISSEIFEKLDVLTPLAKCIPYKILIISGCIYCLFKFLTELGRLPLIGHYPIYNEAVRENLHNYYASSDPIRSVSPSEEQKNEPSPGPKKIRIFNNRSIISDHTSYFENIEQFIAPVAIDIIEEIAGFCHRKSENSQKNAFQGRDDATWIFMLIRLCLLSLMLWIFYIGIQCHLDGWKQSYSCIWGSDKGWWNTLNAVWESGLMGNVLGTLKWPLGITWSLSLCQVVFVCIRSSTR